MERVRTGLSSARAEALHARRKHRPHFLHYLYKSQLESDVRFTIFSILLHHFAVTLVNIRKKLAL